jgi:hypothetical protein
VTDVPWPEAWPPDVEAPGPGSPGRLGRNGRGRAGAGFGRTRPRVWTVRELVRTETDARATLWTTLVPPLPPLVNVRTTVRARTVVWALPLVPGLSDRARRGWLRGENRSGGSGFAAAVVGSVLTTTPVSPPIAGTCTTTGGACTLAVSILCAPASVAGAAAVGAAPVDTSIVASGGGVAGGWATDAGAAATSWAPATSLVASEIAPSTSA